jgi:hypothetical protein
VYLLKKQKTSSKATLIAPTTPVNWLFAPAASATGVRDELLYDGGCADHGDQYSGHALAALEQQDQGQRARTDRKRSPVGFPLQHGLRYSE